MQLFVFSLWIIVSLKVIKDSVFRMDMAVWNKTFFEAFAYYNPLFMMAMMVWLWGVNVQVFLRSRVNYAKVFDLDHNHLTHWEIWKIASWMTVLVLTSLTAYLYLESYGERKLAASQPVIVYCLLPLLLALPVNALFASSRFYFLSTIVRMIFPFQPISFADFFVADVLTSMSKVLSDVERVFCRIYYHQVTGVPEDDANLMCGNHSYWIPCILAFPYLCRFFQCLRQFSDTGDKSCLLNALKYTTTFPVIVLSALKYHMSDVLVWEATYRPLWLLCCVINTCYSFYWDVTRDWDLGLLTGNCKTKKSALRSSMLYNQRWVYFWAISSNLLLRCSWTFKLSAHLRHNRLTVFTFSGLEMLRRFQWIFFRVESEYNKMITSSSAVEIPLTEVVEEKERLFASDHDT
ncbi:xenotropic and polytropic retrovirus receptor 1 [Marchantia polymorpha subsp. ruderalis]|uniref:EXS domain-containing protein n=2 Tax=Marchantia polymorpha TaxID=3197 RepID=A0AAF6BQ50_MARPO|nr:hypothetical protein MARPO_0060s0006 [Marchantia polymorpha]PTQ36910.1 hypothetical protein MARPO_0060s0006 [Marchantia polymorpha]BBN14133.1 hypothetical protein Mp_6g09130 [Marchantia polymorpha subsp. ruderalis]BBN14134.1 hypothetical protein Mp_6g09130 [Marchantia polymorpha subsp. ruderalis]|eukprot:PTQ36909.1 hypothetical protein MARPO_0060s0006 [Marchantia polymorpha]